MTTILLVRHAMCDHVGSVIAGRTPGVSLNATGQSQAEHLASRLAETPIAAIYTSPLQRARETAAAIASRTNVEPQVCDVLNEIDYGAWTGKSVAELQPLPEWRQYNSHRETTRIPDGELMLEVQARAVAGIEHIRATHPNETIVAVSHGDVIKAILAHYLGFSLDHATRLEIDPASVSTMQLGPWATRIVRVNEP